MRFRKIINILSLAGAIFCGQSLSANATSFVDRYHSSELKSKLDPQQHDFSYKKLTTSQKELNDLQNEILADLAEKVRRLPEDSGFEENINKYKEIITDLMRGLSTSSLPFRNELVKILEGHKKAISESAEKSYFLSDKMVFDILEDGQENNKEHSVQKAFENGLRMSEDSFEILKRMSSQAREKLHFEKDHLKILLIQMLSDNHVKCGNRRRCLEQDERVMEEFKRTLPGSLKFGVIIDKYINDLREKSDEQSVLPIILNEIRKKMGRDEWNALLEKDSTIADEMMSDRDEWVKITKKEPDDEVLYPWTDPAAEQAKKEKEEKEAEKKAEQEAAEREKNKSQFQKTKEELTNQAKTKATQKLNDKGKELTKKLIDRVLGNSNEGSNNAGEGFLKGFLG
jgi:hypothetical protein